MFGYGSTWKIGLERVVKPVPTNVGRVTRQMWLGSQPMIADAILNLTQAAS